MPQKPKYNLPDINSNHHVGKNIAALRKSHGLSQKDLAEEVGITQSLLSSYEIGRLNIPIDIVIQIAITLKADSNIMLGLKNSGIREPLPKKMLQRLKLIEKLPPFDKKSLLKMIDTTLKAAGLEID